MRKNEVQIGKTYYAKVSGKVSEVKILSESPYGGWNGINTATGRKVRIRSAQRLRREVVTPRLSGTAQAARAVENAEHHRQLDAERAKPIPVRVELRPSNWWMIRRVDNGEILTGGPVGMYYWCDKQQFSTVSHVTREAAERFVGNCPAPKMMLQRVATFVTLDEAKQEAQRVAGYTGYAAVVSGKGANKGDYFVTDQHPLVRDWEVLECEYTSDKHGAVSRKT